ncbi:hypothetical protein LOK49_LG10G02952 [Camellia lanceoleosa]|uniref:Uncharacterized protein n=1 Tax=Camellia lanceoleosa TaxID=1840588 RepID=A0ACC0GBI9_9ERIC|nr:hypothetical protein LOK49_LG10G02952 [Camellia lanceoleosa]
MPSPELLATAATMLRNRLSSALRTRVGGRTTAGTSRWATADQERRRRRKWEDWELPCYITSFLTIVICGFGFNSKTDLTIESWAHHKALDQMKFSASSDESD